MSEDAEDAEDPEVSGVTEEPVVPFLRVVRGDPSAEEVAALVAVLASLGGGEPPAPRARPEWAAAYRQARAPLGPGPGAWRASALPR